MGLDSFASRHFGADHFFALGHPSVDLAEAAAIEAGDVTQAFAVDYSPLHLTPHEIMIRRRFIRKIIADQLAVNRQKQEADELAMLALVALEPRRLAA